jgi:DNA-binding NtrC family response regulator
MPQERILIVDDEESVRSVTAAVLERSGYAATTTKSAEDALLRLQQDPDYDLILSDIMMPGTDGLTLLDHICTDYPGMPVVIFSAVNDFHVVTSAFRRGAIDYLLKPFEHAELESIVMRAVEHGRLRKQNTTYRQNLESIVSARTGRLRSTMQDLERSYDITLEAMATRSTFATKKPKATPDESPPTPSPSHKRWASTPMNCASSREAHSSTTSEKSPHPTAFFSSPED